MVCRERLVRWAHLDYRELRAILVPKVIKDCQVNLNILRKIKSRHYSTINSGPEGQDGTPGSDGTPGRDGKDGNPGFPGEFFLYNNSIIYPILIVYS